LNKTHLYTLNYSTRWVHIVILSRSKLKRKKIYVIGNSHNIRASFERACRMLTHLWPILCIICVPKLLATFILIWYHTILSYELCCVYLWCTQRYLCNDFELRIQYFLRTYYHNLFFVLRPCEYKTGRAVSKSTCNRIKYYIYTI